MINGFYIGSCRKNALSMGIDMEEIHEESGETVHYNLDIRRFSVFFTIINILP